MDLLESVLETSLKDENYDDELLVFLDPYFQSQQGLRDFLEKCYGIPTHEAKRALHQLYRFMSLSQEIENLKTLSVKDGVQIFFWIVSIEAIYKATNTELKLKKAELIRGFFRDYISSEDQKLLLQGIIKQVDPPVHTTIEIVADMFNTVRNMFAHEGIYWMFTFPEKINTSSISILPKEKTSYLSTYTMGVENLITYEISLTKKEINDIIIRGALKYIQEFELESNS